ncbi:hypothetical protein BSU04_04155 [Caballeronia sordidicola]|uniref:Uncharacterized protein n=1 Tax=Caballeronia sordidicola TaxID=196367 RepID=A0A226XA58_CABSO|nr:hypothetical protein BSU04_04155 [Caballeronia sordidicola]
MVGWVSCAMAAEAANTHAERDKTDAAKGKIFTTKLHQ